MKGSTCAVARFAVTWLSFLEWFLISVRYITVESMKGAVFFDKEGTLVLFVDCLKSTSDTRCQRIANFVTRLLVATIRVG